MADLFDHPLTIEFVLEKVLKVNGVDIFEKVRQAFNHSLSFEFGKSIGEAINTVNLHNPNTKSENDVNGFNFLDYFLTGFYNSKYFYIKYYGETLYNSMNGLGS